MTQRKMQRKEIPLSRLTLMALLLMAMVAVITFTTPILFPRIVFAQTCNNPGGCTLASTSGGGSSYSGCAVYPALSADNGGFALPQAILVLVSALGYQPHCISNNSANTYFVPRRTYNEMQSFLNAAARLNLYIYY
jgi:hypothetical protein